MQGVGGPYNQRNRQGFPLERNCEAIDVQLGGPVPKGSLDDGVTELDCGVVGKAGGREGGGGGATGEGPCA